MLVFSNSQAGQEAEFNRWYDEVHIPDVLRHSEATAAQRFRLSEVQWNETGPHKYLAIYEFEVASKEAAASLRSNMSKMDRSGSRSTDETKIVFYDAVSERFEK